MRKNVKNAVQSWSDRSVNYTSPTISTDGNTIFSYNTAILERVGSDMAILNVTRYSQTTTKQQNAVASLLKSNGFKFSTVDNVPIDTRTLIGHWICDLVGAD